MSNIVTQAELLEIVPELRAKAAAEPTEKVREALNRLADRYAAMGGGNGIAATTSLSRQTVRRCAQDKLARA
jgi:hypothetical protein